MFAEGDHDDLFESFPLLKSDTPAPPPSAVTASALLAAAITAKSSANPYRTLSAPIDHVVGPLLRPGYALQISGPPGTCVEQLLVGLIKSATAHGKEAMVVDMQCKLTADMIARALEGDERVDRVYYRALHTLDELVAFLSDFSGFVAEHEQVESNFSTRNAVLTRVRETIVRLCKQHNMVIVATSTMSAHFVNADGSRGTFGDHSRGVLTPQIDLSCKAISSLVISRKNRTSGRAVLIPATSQQKCHVEFDFMDLKPQERTG